MKKKKSVNFLIILGAITFFISVAIALSYLIQKFQTNYIFALFFVLISMLVGTIFAYFLIKGKNNTYKNDNKYINHLPLMEDLLNLSYVDITPDLNIVYTNKNAGILFSTPFSKSFDSSLRTIIPQEYLPDDDIADIFSGKKDSVLFSIQLRYGSEYERHLQCTALPFFDGNKKVRIFFVDYTDKVKMDDKIDELNKEIAKIRIEADYKVEESIKVNDKIRDSIRILSDIFIAAPVGFIVLDQDSNITNFNRAAENIFNYHENDIIGKNMDILHTARHFNDEFLLKSVEGKNVEGEVDCIRSDLSHFVGMVRVKPVFDDNHNVIRYVLSVNDVTKRANFEKFIILKNQELTSINDIFISTNQYNELDKKLDVFFDKLFDNLEVVRKGLIYLKTEAEILELCLYKGFHYTQLKDLKELETKGTLCGELLQAGKSILCKADEIATTKDPLKENGISSNHIYIPIKYKKEPFGILIIFPNKNYHFDTADLDFFDMISNELGICIKQALEFEELKQKLQNLPE